MAIYTAIGTNSYVVTINQPQTFGYSAGLTLSIRFQNSNTGSSTVRIEFSDRKLASLYILRPDGSPLSAGDIASGGVYNIVCFASTINASSRANGFIFQLSGAGGDFIRTIADTDSIDLDVTNNELKANLTTTGVVAGTYGSATQIPVLTIDSKGRVFVASQVAAPSGDKNYVHPQAIASSSWVVIHNLNKRCAVNVLKSTFEELGAEVIWNSDNQVTINFNKPRTGYVYCN